jgi:hypothetical protein
MLDPKSAQNDMKKQSSLNCLLECPFMIELMTDRSATWPTQYL